MTDPIAEILDRSLALTPQQRSRLVEQLLETLHEPPLAEIEQAWAAEIERRVAAHERGDMATYAAEDVFAEARRIAP